MTEPTPGTGEDAGRVLAALDAADGTLFAPQARAAAGLSGPAFEAALADLDGRGLVVVAHHRSPDPHLRGDWRSVSLVRPGTGATAAATAGRSYFDRWLREFLQHHRCT